MVANLEDSEDPDEEFMLRSKLQWIVPLLASAGLFNIYCTIGGMIPTQLWSLLWSCSISIIRGVITISWTEQFCFSPQLYA